MSDDLSSLMREAESLFRQRDYDAAIEVHKQLLGMDPDNEEVCQRLATLFAIRGLVSNVIATYFDLSEIFERKGEFAHAVEVTEWVLKLQPESDKARLRQISIYQAQGDSPEVLRRSLALARIYIELGRGDESIDLLKTALQVDPGNLEIGAELAEMYVRHGHIQEGAQQFRRIAHEFMGQGQLDRAADAFKRLKLIHPDDPETHFTLGRLYTDLGRYVDAEAEYRAILRHDLNHLEALAALGDVCEKKGQLRDAILAFNKILNINPQDLGAKARLGDLYLANKNPEEAVKFYLSAANAYQMVEDQETAVEMFLRVIRVDPVNSTAIRELTNLGVSQADIDREVAAVAERRQQEEEAAAQRRLEEERKRQERLAAGEAVGRGDGLVMRDPGAGKQTRSSFGPPSAKADGGMTRKGAGTKATLGGSKMTAGGKGKATLDKPRLGGRSLPSVQEAVAEDFEVPSSPFEQVEEPPLPYAEGVEYPMQAEVLGDLGMGQEIPSDSDLDTVTRAAGVRSDVVLDAPQSSHGEDEFASFEADSVPALPGVESSASQDADVSSSGGAVEEAQSRAESASPVRPGLMRGGGLRRSRPESAGEPAASPIVEEAQAAVVMERPQGLRRGLRGLRASSGSAEAMETPSAEPVVSEVIAGTTDFEASGAVAMPAELPMPAPGDTEPSIEVAGVSSLLTQVQAVQESEWLEGPPGGDSFGVESEEPAVTEVDSAVVSVSLDSEVAIAAFDSQEVLEGPPVPSADSLLSEPVLATAHPEEPGALIAVDEPVSSKTEQPSVPMVAHFGPGDRRRALTTLRKALEQSPDDHAKRYELASLLSALGLLDEAQGEWIALIKADHHATRCMDHLVQCILWAEQPEGAVQLLVRMADRFRAEGDTQRSASALQSALAIQPEDAAARFELADLAIALGNHAAARWHFRKGVQGAEGRGDGDRVVEARRRLYELSGSFEDGLHLAQALERYGRVEEALQEFGRVARLQVQAGVLGEARGTLAHIVSMSPRDVVSREQLLALQEADQCVDLSSVVELARLHRECGSLSRSQELYELFLGRVADASDIREEYVGLLLEQGHVDEARTEAAGLLESWFRDGVTDKAVHLLARFIQAAPADVSVREQMITFYERANDAEAVCDQRLALSSLLIEQDKSEEALKLLEQALAVDDTSTKVLYRLAVYHLEVSKQASLAEGYLQKLRALDPRNAPAGKVLVKLLLQGSRIADATSLLVELGSQGAELASVRDELIVEYKSLVAENSEDWTSRYVLGVLYKESGLLEPAIVEFQETRKVKELLLPSYNMLGCCFALKRGFNQEELAIKQFRKGLETKGYPDQDYLELRYNLADMHDRRNEVAEAVRHLEEIYAVDVHFKDAAQRLERLRGESGAGQA